MTDRRTGGRVVSWLFVGVALAAVATLILVMVIRLASSNSTDVTDLDVGDCFVIETDADGTVEPVDVIDCGDPHDAEVLVVADLNPDGDLDYPADDDLFALADAACAPIDPDPGFGILPIAPTASTWEARAGRVVCLAVPYGDDLVTVRYGAPTGT
jgi:hypothetical protein